MPHTSEDLFRLLGASNHCKDNREEHDYYTTDPECIDDLLAVESFSDTILEPCCGCGNLAEALWSHGHRVVASDLYDHEYGETGVDYEYYKDIQVDVITNPPYALQTEFAEYMLKELRPGRKMALFLKIQFLEGQERQEKIFSQGKLEKVYIYTKRVACYKNNEMYQKDENGEYLLDKDGNKKKIGSAACYAWFVFNTSYNGYPQIRWINK